MKTTRRGFVGTIAVGAAAGVLSGTTFMSKGASAQTREALKTGIHIYSFALKPEEHQPSGTCNFSRIDTAHLEFNTAPGATFTVYAVNYNVLRIMSGMGGLAYSN